MGLESPTVVTACLGNIVEQPDCDAIVNSANTSLCAGSGVCGAIHKAAGPELERYAVQFAPLGLAQAVATPGFNLPNRIVIHCRGPNFHFDPNPTSNLGLCLENVLALSGKEGVRRIAIPAISMGVYGFPLDEATHILAAKATAYARNARQLQEIRFVVRSRDILAKFVDAINQLQTS